METERDCHFPFLDIDIYRRLMDFWANKRTVNLPIPVSTKTQALITTHPTSMPYFPLYGFGVSGRHLQAEWLQRPADSRDPQPSPGVDQPDGKPDSVTFVPYVVLIFNRISGRALFRHIKSVGLPSRKISNFLRSVKDNLGLKTSGMYSISL
jgi:hypothetical protein